MSEKTWQETAKLLIASMDDDFDWDDELHGEFYFEDDFHSVVKIVPDDFKTEMCEFGSHKTEYTPDSLYRLLWLCRPEKVSFKDMYKVPLFCVMPPDQSCVVQLYLFKYELALYFFASKSDITSTRNNHGIISGAPGSDNGWTCSNESVNLFTQLLVKATESEHVIYGGNNFAV